MPTANPHRSTRRLAITLACATTLALAACHPAPPPPSNVTPEKAVATNLRLTATGDFDGLMKNRLPPADYGQWRAEWDKSHAHQAPASETQQRQFGQIMRMLTEPGAETKLTRRLQPELAKLRGGKNGPMPIFSGILQAAGQEMIASSPQLGAAQKTLATQALAALVAWAKTADFSDPGKARKAIALVCATARDLHVQTLDQWRGLDYAQTMHNYGTIWRGLEALLNLYGINLASSLTTANVTATGDTGTHATVKLDMNFAGQALSGEWPMVKQAGHWYDAALLAAWQKAHPAPATTAASPAARATAAAAAGMAPAVHAGAASSSTRPAAANPAPSARPAPAASGARHR